jgi:hypothetical protein
VPEFSAAIGPPPASQSAPDDLDGPPPVFEDPPALETTPEVPEPVVRGMLASAGTILGISPLADPDVPEHWKFTERELDDLTPPLTRIVNARPQLRAAAARGDELTVLVQLLGYGGRNVLAAHEARKTRAQDEGDTWDAVDREAGAHASGAGGAAGAAVVGVPGWGDAGPGAGVAPPEA